MRSSSLVPLLVSVAANIISVAAIYYLIHDRYTRDKADAIIADIYHQIDNHSHED